MNVLIDKEDHQKIDKDQEIVNRRNIIEIVVKNNIEINKGIISNISKIKIIRKNIEKIIPNHDKEMKNLIIDSSLIFIHHYFIFNIN